MKWMKWIVVPLAVLPLACGGDVGGPRDEEEGEAEAEAEAEAEGEVLGLLVASAMPAIDGESVFQLFVDGEMKVEVPTGGEEVQVELPVGRHDVSLVGEGYGYAVPGHEFSTYGSQTVEDWVMEDVRVEEGEAVEVVATVCRDVTDPWQTPGDGVREVYMTTEDGSCVTWGFSPYNFEVQGDTVTVRSTGGCGGLTAPILDNGTRIVLECPGGTLEYTRVN